MNRELHVTLREVVPLGKSWLMIFALGLFGGIVEFFSGNQPHLLSTANKPELPKHHHS